MEGGEIIEPLGDRVLGRVALDDVIDPVTSETIVGRITKSPKISCRGSTKPVSWTVFKIRSVLDLRSRRRASASCATVVTCPADVWINIGEAVGVIALSPSVNRALSSRCVRSTSVVLRISSSRAIQPRSTNDGSIKFINLTTVINKEGDLVVMNRNGELAIVDYPRQNGRERERERYPVVYGASSR